MGTGDSQIGTERGTLLTYVYDIGWRYTSLALSVWEEIEAVAVSFPSRPDSAMLGLAGNFWTTTQQPAHGHDEFSASPLPARSRRHLS